MKQAPAHPIFIDRTVFENNKGPQSFGGAIHSKATIKVDRSRFHGNEAREGGAIFLDTVANLVVSNTSFVGNKADDGGAIAACATLTDNGCAGAYEFAAVRAEGNIAYSADAERGGGAFGSFNGGVSTFREVELLDNFAGPAREPSGMGFAYSAVDLHRVHGSNATVKLTNTGVLRTFCSAELAVTQSSTHNEQWEIDARPTECSLCEPGTEWVTDTYTCVACERGTYKAEGDASCKRCPSGKHQDQSGKTSCDSCASGKSSNKRRTQCVNVIDAWVVPLLIALGALIVVAGLAFLCLRLRAAARARKRLEAERAVVVQEQCTAARERVDEFQALFATLPGAVRRPVAGSADGRPNSPKYIYFAQAGRQVPSTRTIEAPRGIARRSGHLRRNGRRRRRPDARRSVRLPLAPVVGI